MKLLSSILLSMALSSHLIQAEYTYSDDADEMAMREREKPKKKYTPRATGHI